MITNSDIHEELKLIEEAGTNEKDPYKKSVLVGIKLIVKLLHNLRTNSVIQMKHAGIETTKPGKPAEK
jgi:hypothetical protein